MRLNVKKRRKALHQSSSVAFTKHDISIFITILIMQMAFTLALGRTLFAV